MPNALSRWTATYEAARQAASDGEEREADRLFGEANEIEEAMIAAPAGFASAQASLAAAIRLMTDECEGDAEPSYAELLRAALAQLDVGACPFARLPANQNSEQLSSAI